MESPVSKPDGELRSNFRSHTTPEGHTFLPFLEGSLWQAPTLSPLLMSTVARDPGLPHFWHATFPWLPQFASLWASGTSKPEGSHLTSAPSAPDSASEGSSTPHSGPLPYRSSREARDVSASPVAHVTPSSLMDPLIALTAMEATPVITRALVSSLPRRPRSEKRPIPEEQKDDKYFERRKRNNMAAKKSRDARKAREDEIALRACFLEKENAILRAQVTTLREEAQSLRQLLLQKRHPSWCKA